MQWAPFLQLIETKQFDSSSLQQEWCLWSNHFPTCACTGQCCIHLPIQGTKVSCVKVKPVQSIHGWTYLFNSVFACRVRDCGQLIEQLAQVWTNVLLQTIPCLQPSYGQQIQQSAHDSRTCFAFRSVWPPSTQQTLSSGRWFSTDTSLPLHITIYR